LEEKGSLRPPSEGPATEHTNNGDSIEEKPGFEGSVQSARRQRNAKGGARGKRGGTGLMSSWLPSTISGVDDPAKMSRDGSEVAPGRRRK